MILDMRSVRYLAVTIITCFLSLVFTSSAQASLVTIEEGGEVVINVLSAEESIELEIPQREYLAVKDIVETDSSPDTRISFSKDGEEIRLNVSTAQGDKSLDVSNYLDPVVEIEERPQTQKLSIGVKNGLFEIKQKGITVQTDYEISIDPKTAGLTLKTPSGLRFLSILPLEAANSIFRTKLINRLPKGNAMKLVELEGRELAYEITGDKVISILNVYNHSIPVTTKISASTGEILTIDEPSWLKVFSFLFV